VEDIFEDKNDEKITGFAEKVSIPPVTQQTKEW